MHVRYTVLTGKWFVMFKTMKKLNSGFTLVELLVVIVLIGIISGVASSILTIVLRTDNKASVSSSVQQNGDYIITQFSNNVRNAQKFIAVYNGASPDSVDCRETTPGTPISGCTYPDGSSGGLCASGTSYSMLEYVDNNGIVRGVSCNNNIPSYLTFSSTAGSAPSVQSWINNVSSSACSISCTQASSLTTPYVGISFTLSKGSGTAENTQGAQTFQTSVLIRNQ